MSNKILKSEREIALSIFLITLTLFIIGVLAVNKFNLNNFNQNTISAISDALIGSVAITTLYIGIEKFLIKKTHSIKVSWGLFSGDQHMTENGISCKILNDGPNLITVESIHGYSVEEREDDFLRIGEDFQFFTESIKPGESAIFQICKDEPLYYHAEMVVYKTADQNIKTSKESFKKGLSPFLGEKEMSETSNKIYQLLDFSKKEEASPTFFSKEEIENKNLNELKNKMKEK